MKRTRSRHSLLDDLDRRILKRLELDARLPNQDLAREIGLSPSACLQRVKRLEKNGVIRRYIVDVDEAELDGLLIFHGEIVLTAAGRASRKALEETLNTRPEIIQATQVVGRADYILTVGGAHPATWPTLIEQLDPEGRLIATSRVQSHVRVAKRFSGWPIPT